MKRNLLFMLAAIVCTGNLYVADCSAEEMAQISFEEADDSLEDDLSDPLVAEDDLNGNTDNYSDDLNEDAMPELMEENETKFDISEEIPVFSEEEYSSGDEIESEDYEIYDSEAVIEDNSEDGFVDGFITGEDIEIQEAADTLLNSDYSTARAISVNSTYSDNLTSSSDVNWYKFTVYNAGYISLSFKHDYIESGYTYWKAYLYNSSMKELTSYSFSGSTTVSTKGKIGIPSGTYYLKINKYEYSDKNYNIIINYTSSDIWETEFNDSYDLADTIEVNTTYYGSLCDSDDVDWYKFTVSGNGYISLSFNHDYIESGYTYWKAYLYNSNMKELTSYSFSGSTISSTEGKIGIPSGTYYVKINKYEYSDKNYNIKFNYNSSNAWETEFNDSYDTADSVGVNSTYYGSLCDSDDVDWYRFTIPTGGMQKLYFNHEYVSSGYTYWKAYIYNSSMTEIASYSYSGDKTSYVNNVNLKAGVYLIKISKYEYSDVKYSLKICPHVHSYKNVVTKATTSKNGKIVKTCSCGATNGKTIIYYPKTVSLSTKKYTYDGNTKKPSVSVKGSDGKTISSSNYSVSYASGRKNVGTYSVKITFKGNYSGSVTRTFVINPRPTSISKLSGASKGFSVSWDKKTTQVKGYQVQCSTSSSFSNCITKTITKNTTTTAKFDGLKSKRKYYVRVRTYMKVSDKAYFSSWSAVKTVTTK